MYTVVDLALVMKLNNICPIHEMKFRHVWSNFHLLILYFNFFLKIMMLIWLVNHEKENTVDEHCAQKVLIFSCIISNQNVSNIV